MSMLPVVHEECKTCIYKKTYPSKENMLATYAEYLKIDPDNLINRRVVIKMLEEYIEFYSNGISKDKQGNKFDDILRKICEKIKKLPKEEGLKT